MGRHIGRREESSGDKSTRQKTEYGGATPYV